MKDRTFVTSDLQGFLRSMHPSNEWALMFEVAPRTGGGTRYADAVAVNLWNSRGHAVHGFEIKASRSDWQRELKAPEKSEDVLGYCDYWWVVAPEGVVHAGELPMGWGLLEPALVRGAAGRIKKLPEGVEPALADLYKLAVTVKAGKLKAKPVSREFFASLIRRANEVIDRIADQRFDAERRLLLTSAAEQIQRDVDGRTRKYKELQSRVEKFKEETGLEFSPWSGPPAGVIALAQQLHEMSGYGKNEAFMGKLLALSEELDKSAQRVRDAVLGVAAELPKPEKLLEDHFS